MDTSRPASSGPAPPTETPDAAPGPEQADTMRPEPKPAPGTAEVATEGGPPAAEDTITRPLWWDEMGEAPAEEDEPELPEPALPPGPPPRVILPWAVPPGYEALEVLARTTRSVVVKARSVRWNRVVAVVLLPGADVSPEGQVRFRLEAEGIAYLEHPNILQVLEVGAQQGFPYLVLEYLEGNNVAAAVRDGRWAAGDRAAQHDVARIVQALAQAVDHAHRRGVLHRDLTPGNILLTPDGTPKLCDFGLAKRHGGAAAPNAPAPGAGVTGAPSYVAPELTEGKPGLVSTATDVYALGAILYELLTGRPPFQGATPAETLLLVRSQDPLPPRELQPRVHRDLQAICLKCLEKDPARRYDSALALAEDLERFAQGRPVEARPRGGWRRSVLLALRGAAAVLVVAGALAVGGWLAGNGWWFAREPAEARAETPSQPAAPLAIVAQAPGKPETNKRPVDDEASRQARLLAQQKEKEAAALRQEVKRLRREADDQRLALENQRQTTEKERQEAQRQRDLAKAEKQNAQQLLAEAKKEREQAGTRLRPALVALEQLVTTVSRSDTAAAPEAREQLLKEALRFYQDFLAEKRDGSAPDAETARAWRRVGDIQRRLGNPKEAETAYRRGLELEQRVVREGTASPEARAELAESYGNLAAVLAGQRKAADAEPFSRKAVDEARRLADGFPAKAAYRKSLANALCSLGNLQRQAGKAAVAEATYRGALDLRRRLAEEAPADRTRREELADTQTRLALLYAAEGQRKEAEDGLRQSLKLLKELAGAGPLSRKHRLDLARCTSSLGLVLRERGDLPGAEQAARQAVDQWQQLAREQPGAADAKEGLARAYIQRGRCLMAKAPREAEQDFGQARDLCRKVLEGAPKSAEANSQLGEALYNLGGLRAARGDVEQARGLLREAVTYQQEALKADPKNLTYQRALRNHYNWLAEAQVRFGDHAGARDAALRLAAVFPERWQDAYAAARLLAQCARLAGEDRKLGSGDRTSAAEKNAASAVALLRQAIQHGLPKKVRLDQEPDLQPVRSRADFQELLRQAGSANPPPALPPPAGASRKSP
jgi:tetratricopeptide (TPR) repeat protein